MLLLDPLMYVDPFAANNQKAVEIVGANLQHQYERWQPRARYKLSLDPTVDDVRKLCSSLRRNAKDERVLFHYNGHGVPRPTTNGEIWVFNKVSLFVSGHSSETVSADNLASAVNLLFSQNTYMCCCE